MLVTVSCCQCLHIAAHCRTGYNQLHRLRSVLRSLSADTNTTMVQAFASSRLDYCNSLLHGIRDYSQYRKPLHVWSRALEWSTTRRQLHWLPVLQRIEFKVICFFYQSLTGHAPVYLVDDCGLASESNRRQLCSSDVPTCVVPPMRTRFRDGSFSAAGPRLWNALPLTLYDIQISALTVYRLETHLLCF